MVFIIILAIIICSCQVHSVNSPEVLSNVEGMTPTSTFSWALFYSVISSIKNRIQNFPIKFQKCPSAYERRVVSHVQIFQDFARQNTKFGLKKDIRSDLFLMFFVLCILSVFSCFEYDSVFSSMPYVPSVAGQKWKSMLIHEVHIV